MFNNIREILFRGKSKSINKGKWIYGSFVEDTDLNACCIRDKSLAYELVERETIGQFTGLTDKNGKKIFEGDIVEYILDGRKNKNIGYIHYYKENCSFVIVPNDTDFCFPEHDYIDDVKNITIIGNIYDNTNLILF